MPRARVLSTGAATAGQRDRLVTIERLVESLPDSNFPTETWGDPFTAWAARDFLQLDERVQSDLVMATAESRWDMAYTRALDPDLVDVANKCRLLYQGRIHNIISAQMMSRADGRAIVLTTKVQVG